MDNAIKKLLQKQQYAFTGRHSAVKLCRWTKKAIRGEGHCYKQEFYGIESHRCVQLAPGVTSCQNRCIFCWRPIEFTDNEIGTPLDQPDEIIDNALAMQKRLLSGFGGTEKTDIQKFKQSKEPKHFAISLAGEPTLYPKLNELISAVHRRGMTSFVVTNGMLPERLEGIEPPTQLYLSVDAPNESLFKKIDQPTLEDGWKRLIQSLDAVKKLKSKTRTTLRLTLIKGMNMVHPEQWAELIMKAEPMFVEVKAYMFVGFSRQRLLMENMPLHNEVRDFAMEISKHCPYTLVMEKKESRVVLMMREGMEYRLLNKIMQEKK